MHIWSMEAPNKIDINQFLVQEEVIFSKNCKRLTAALPESEKTATRKDIIISLIKTRIKNGVSLDLMILTPFRERSPLCLTSQSDTLLSVTKKILRYGADPNVANNMWPITPLSLAVESGAIKTIKLLLMAGANPCKMRSNNHLLHRACSEAIEEYRDIKKWTRIIRLLLRNGANPNFKNDMGYAPLFIITGEGKNPFGQKVLPIIKLLLSYGADVNINDGALFSYAQRYNPVAADFLKDWKNGTINLKKKLR